MRRLVALAGFLLVVTLPVAARAQETATLQADHVVQVALQVAGQLGG